MRRMFGSLGMDGNAIAEAVLIYATIEKMDNDTRKQWKLTWADNDLPSLDSVQKFLREHAERRISEEDECKQIKAITYHQTGKKEHDASKQNKQKFQTSTKEKKCSFGCTHPHWSSECRKFQKLSTEQRLELLKKHSMCFNCFGNHTVANCTSRFRCQKLKNRTRILGHQIVTMVQCFNKYINSNND
jgi:hypothetical protein